MSASFIPSSCAALAALAWLTWTSLGPCPAHAGASVSAAALSSPSDGAGDASAAALAPRIAETRYYRMTQTVALHDVPEGASRVRLWAAIPGDGPWQRVLERRVVEAPAGWRLVREPTSMGEMVYVELPAGSALKDPATVVVESLIRRDAPVVDLAVPAPAEPPLQRELFAEFLRLDAPNMVATDQVRSIARAACAGESDPRRKVAKLLEAVANVADHYSKDPSKPHCGRGSAEDCMANGGGCCTDLHSLFIAMARAEGIPARLQMGYRLKPENEGKTADPGYRCWVEYWLDGSGWVATDIVVADGGDSEARRAHWGRLDARRVWLWQGRGFDLSPKQAAPPIQTMFCGWAEIDGQPVDPLPFTDGTPSKLRRTVRFEDVTDEFVATR